MPPVDALVIAIDRAEAVSASAGREISGAAEDLDAVARGLGASPGDGGWSGHAGARARGRAADAAVEVRMIAGACLFLSDLLRVEGARLARAVIAYDDDEAAVPGSGDGVSVADSDRVLAMRLREAADSLAGLVDPDTRPCLDLAGTTGGDPRVTAALWHSLGPADRERLVRDHPDLGSVAGLSSATRDAINRTRLRRLLGADGAAGGAGRTALAALAEHLAADPRRHLLSLHPEGRAVVASGDPDGAGRVVTLVPGTGSSLHELGRTAERAAAMCEAADAGTECVAVSWQGYDAPQSVAAAGTSAGRAIEHAPDLRTYAAGLDAVESMDGHDAPHTAVGYSYGSVVLGAAAADPRGLAADRMLHVGSPGAGVDSIDQQWVDEGGVPRAAHAHEVVGVVSRWDPVPWWSVSGVLGERPGASDFGGLGVDVTEPGSGARSVDRAHSTYFDPGTVSLEEIGRLITDTD